MKTGLHWSIRRSFAAYVAGLPDGRLALSDEVVLGSEDRLFFPLDRDGQGSSALAFKGTATFTGHFGLLHVRIGDLCADLLAGGGGVLTHIVNRRRVPLVTFHIDESGSPEHSGSLLRGADVSLAPDSASLFGDVYNAGAPFDDFLIVRSPE